MKWLFSLFGGGIYGYLIAAGLSAALAIGATYTVVHNANAVTILGLEKAIEKKRADDNSASLSQLQGFIADIHIAQTNYQATLDTIAANYAAIKGQWKNATAKPLPVDCIPTADRVRSVNAAIGAANKATAATP